MKEISLVCVFIYNMKKVDRNSEDTGETSTMNTGQTRTYVGRSFDMETIFDNIEGNVRRRICIGSENSVGSEWIFNMYDSVKIACWDRKESIKNYMFGGKRKIEDYFGAPSSSKCMFIDDEAECSGEDEEEVSNANDDDLSDVDDDDTFIDDSEQFDQAGYNDIMPPVAEPNISKRMQNQEKGNEVWTDNKDGECLYNSILMCYFYQTTGALENTIATLERIIENKTFLDIVKPYRQQMKQIKIEDSYHAIRSLAELLNEHNIFLSLTVKKEQYRYLPIVDTVSKSRTSQKSLISKYDSIFVNHNNTAYINNDNYVNIPLLF